MITKEKKTGKIEQKVFMKIENTDYIKRKITIRKVDNLNIKYDPIILEEDGLTASGIKVCLRKIK